MSVTAAIRDLIAKGFTVEQALDAAEIFESQMPQRTARQERNRRYYEKKKSERLNKTNSDDSDVVPSRARVENKSQTNKPTGKNINTPRDELLTALDARRADAVIEHRKKIRRPLTAHAAHLLANKFRKCADPNEAADAMIANGWQGFDADWLLKRKLPQATSPPEKQTAMQAYDEIARERGWTKDEPEFLPSDNSDAQRLSAERGGREGVVVDLRKSADGSFGSGGQ